MSYSYFININLLTVLTSGVSIIRVDGHDSYERVSGSAIGGGNLSCSIQVKNLT